MPTDPFPIFHAMSGGDGVVPVEKMEDMSALSEETIKPYKVEEKMYDHRTWQVDEPGSRVKYSESIFRRKSCPDLLRSCFYNISLFSYTERIQPSKSHMRRGQSPSSKQAIFEKQGCRDEALDRHAAHGERHQRDAEQVSGVGRWGYTPRSSVKGANMERSRLVQARTLAHRRGDHREVLGAQIVEFDAKYGTSDPGSTSVNGGTGGWHWRRRRRRAEQQEAERKRKETKMALMGGGDGSGKSTPVDPSARLKTVPRTMLAKTPTPGPSRCVISDLIVHMMDTEI
ncbi:hypothetical protein D9757_014638 [Collybiopsis confluens]|uniref:Uncharacterized protein n=1 Tax=Collybiopsis confluens TaxID=2823264 RepID=A0A8H5CJC3_9AGAR|nr:hypothetical protein D9757_014638 [Collybiopsis confluens]